jgi:hypothetical protein
MTRSYKLGAVRSFTPLNCADPLVLMQDDDFPARVKVIKGHGQKIIWKRNRQCKSGPRKAPH